MPEPAEFLHVQLTCIRLTSTNTLRRHATLARTRVVPPCPRFRQTRLIVVSLRPELPPVAQHVADLAWRRQRGRTAVNICFRRLASTATRRLAENAPRDR